MAAQLKITQRRIGDIAILDLAGRLEIGDGDIELAAFIDRIIGEGGLKVLLNLRDVVHIDSGGIGVIVAKHTSLARRGGALRLLNLTDSTHRALVVTRLLSVFETFTSEADALASFAEGRGTTA